MKKFINILFIVILTLSLTSCNKQAIHNKMEIKTAQLTEKEEKLISLVSPNVQKIYDFKLNNKDSLIKLTFYTLDNEGIWVKNGDYECKLNSSTGRIAISTILENGSLQVSYGENENIITWQSNSKIYENTNNMLKVNSFLQNSNIIYEEEIPLIIQTMTDKNEISSYDDVISSFNNTEKLKEYPIVNAITITFSEDE